MVVVGTWEGFSSVDRLVARGDFTLIISPFKPMPDILCNAGRIISYNCVIHKVASYIQIMKSGVNCKHKVII